MAKATCNFLCAETHFLKLGVIFFAKLRTQNAKHITSPTGPMLCQYTFTWATFHIQYLYDYTLSPRHLSLSVRAEWCSCDSVLAVRLANGPHRCAGRVEVFHNGEWGTVCHDFWNMTDAAVVCKELGCGEAIEAPHSAHFGEGSGRIWLDDVLCTGNESSLMSCGHLPLGTHNCGHHRDAGVICTGKLQ